MADETSNLDEHRGMAAQKATEIRRLHLDVARDQRALRARQEELEKFMVAAPAETWADAVERARYLLGLYAETASAADLRRQRLIHSLLDDFDRLLGAAPPTPPPKDEPPQHR